MKKKMLPKLQCADTTNKIQLSFLHLKDLLVRNNTFNFIMTNYIFLCIVYTMFISNILTNTHDGLWNSDGYSLSVAFDVATGRWLTPLFMKLKLCFAPEPINTLISLLLVSFLSFLIIDIFNQINVFGRFVAFIISLSATFTAQMAYSYMSQAFLIAEFSAILSIWILIKFNAWHKYLISIVLLVIALSFYQGALACYTIVFVFYAMDTFVNKCKNDKNIKDLLSFIIVAAISCVLYFFIWTLVCNVMRIEKSSYMGANSLNIIDMIKSIPDIVKIVYNSFYTFILKGGVIRQNPFIETVASKVLIVGYIMLLLMVPIVKLFKDNKIIIPIYLGLFLISPLLCNPQKFLAVSSEILPQISIGYTLYFPLSLLFLMHCFLSELQVNAIGKLKKVLYVFLILVFLSRGFQISIDFYTMYKTRETSVNIMNLVAKRIIDDDIYSSEYNYVFLGRPYDNALFRKASIYNYANHQFLVGRYYQIPIGWLGGYRGILNYYMGLDLKFDNDIYVWVFNRNQAGEFSNLEAFPSKNCYVLEGNTVIFKIYN